MRIGITIELLKALAAVCDKYDINENFHRIFVRPLEKAIYVTDGKMAVRIESSKIVMDDDETCPEYAIEADEIERLAKLFRQEKIKSHEWEVFSTDSGEAVNTSGAVWFVNTTKSPVGSPDFSKIFKYERGEDQSWRKYRLDLQLKAEAIYRAVRQNSKFKYMPQYDEEYIDARGALRLEYEGISESMKAVIMPYR